MVKNGGASWPKKKQGKNVLNVEVKRLSLEFANVTSSGGEAKSMANGMSANAPRIYPARSATVQDLLKNDVRFIVIWASADCLELSINSLEINPICNRRTSSWKSLSLMNALPVNNALKFVPRSLLIRMPKLLLPSCIRQKHRLLPLIYSMTRFSLFSLNTSCQSWGYSLIEERSIAVRLNVMTTSCIWQSMT